MLTGWCWGCCGRVWCRPNRSRTRWTGGVTFPCRSATNGIMCIYGPIL